MSQINSLALPFFLSAGLAFAAPVDSTLINEGRMISIEESQALSSHPSCASNAKTFYEAQAGEVSKSRLKALTQLQKFTTPAQLEERLTQLASDSLTVVDDKTTTYQELRVIYKLSLCLMNEKSAYQADLNFIAGRAQYLTMLSGDEYLEKYLTLKQGAKKKQERARQMLDIIRSTNN